MRLTVDAHGVYVKDDIINPGDEQYFRAKHPDLVSEDDMAGEPAAPEAKAQAKPAKKPAKKRTKKAG